MGSGQGSVIRANDLRLRLYETLHTYRFRARSVGMNFGKVSIRPALPSEVEQLRMIDKEARKRYLSLKGFERFAASPPINAERFEGGETLVAHRLGAAIGFVFLQIVDDALYVANVSVLPDASGQGVGRYLLRATERRAREISVPAVTLTTFKEPRWNGPWFRAIGFEPIPEDRIGSGLRSILDRHATFMDMSIREILWKKIDRPAPS